MPTTDMFRSGIGLVSGYTLLGAVVLLLAGVGGWTTSLREGLRSLFLWIVRAFLHLFTPLIPSEEQAEEIIDTSEAVTSGRTEIILPETGKPLLIVQILEVALIIALVVLWLFLMYKGTVALIGFVRGRLAKVEKLQTKDIYDDRGLDVREKCEIERSRSRKGKKSSSLFLSPYERVRKLYKKKVQSCALELIEDTDEIKVEKLSLFTARECADKLQLSALADIYEHTRYSGRETTKETVRQMKDVCR